MRFIVIDLKDSAFDKLKLINAETSLIDFKKKKSQLTA